MMIDDWFYIRCCFVVGRSSEGRVRRTLGMCGMVIVVVV